MANRNLLKGAGPRLFGLAIAVFMAASLWLSWRSPLARALRSEEPIFGLLVGTDLVDNARHADTIVLARYRPADRSLDLLSVPRDTRITVPGLRVRRINEVYAWAFRSHKRDHVAASEDLRRALQWTLYAGTASVYSEEFFGSIPSIPFYAQIDYNGFRQIVNLLGGVPVTVDEPMHYDDNWGNLHIHFEPGSYRLDGQKALEFVRYRGHSGDYGRVGRQQQFLLSLLNRIRRPGNLVRLPSLVRASLSAFQTNVSWYERLLLLLELKEISRDRIRLMQLPGHAQNGYWITDSDGLRATADALRGTQTPLPKVSPEPPAPDPDSAPPGDLSKVTVEVWNASKKKGLALTMVRNLRAAGFDVVKWGNFSSRQSRTLVRDHRGNAAIAQALAEALGGRAEVVTRLESNPLVDLEVILGDDYASEGAR